MASLKKYIVVVCFARTNRIVLSERFFLQQQYTTTQQQLKSMKRLILKIRISQRIPSYELKYTSTHRSKMVADTYTAIVHLH